ncbi:MAG: A/G-specific adenine glycosylase [Acidobacteria bacterium]|nr:A/G-specific adenine glycosylase [Acidobacteriota bacterium]
MKDAFAFPMHSASRFQRRVLGWYQRNKRELPWRDNRDPYRIWISEIMLQQTRVKIVLPYYRKFLTRFPDLRSVASAEENEVVSCWSGLGYYRRARELHRAARQISTQGGEFPREFSRILELPGVGRYTAGAIASIAFDARHPVVDGNVRRLFSRYFGKLFSETVCWQLADSLLPKRQVGDYNQALMEIGARICRPKKPLCPACPLVQDCQTRGRPLPGLQRPVTPQAQTMVLLALNREEKFWLELRDSSQRILKNLWCFPMEYGQVGTGELRRRLLRRFGLRSAAQAGSFKHSIMQTRFHSSVVVASFRGKPPGKGVWVAMENLNQFPHSSIVEKAFALLTPCE